MTNRRLVFVLLLALASVAAHAQTWMAAYENGLRLAKSADWAAARAAFQQAIAYRPEDASSPTMLPGPVTERRTWRNGAPYSPNFLAAYSEYRIATGSAKTEDAKPALQTAASEFETLLSKGQNSRETFFFLNQIYTRLGDTAKRLDLESRFSAAKPTFRVDDDVLAPEELTIITGSSAGKNQVGSGPQITVVRPGQGATVLPGTNPNPSTAGGSPAVGPVTPVATKYALIVGNSASQLKDGAVTFGSDDAQAIREALVTHAGYPEANVDLVLNTTADQLRASVKALADRVPEEATVLIFFAGNGANINGKDYLAGVDTASASSSADTGSMVAKSDLFQPFMAKAAKIFAFFEVPRPMTNGTYFGKEVPLVGQIAQVQSTIPGGAVYSQTHNGRQIGIFTDALVTAFQDIRSNHIPIMEFGWQVFNRARGGGSTTTGAGARQIPTLPVLTHLSDQDRF